MITDDTLYLTNKIKAEAENLGFFCCGIAKAQLLNEDTAHLQHWIDKGMHADLSYMTRNTDVRNDVTKLVNNARSVIVCLLSYYNDKKATNPSIPIAMYAWGEDYHYIIKEKLQSIIQLIRHHQPQAEARAFTDSAPVFERRWAQIAGLGWIGKNTHLISPKTGSYFFIGEIVTDIELAYDRPFENNYCGYCTRCLDACPTGALQLGGEVDARKCLSYHTIENKLDIPNGIATKITNTFYGCDICNDVCPWNKKAFNSKISEFKPLPEILNFSENDWLNLSETDFKRIFKKSAINRLKYNRFIRNIEIRSNNDKIKNTR